MNDRISKSPSSTSLVLSEFLARAPKLARTLYRAGLLDPLFLSSLQHGFWRWGLSPGAVLVGGALRRGLRAAIIDERGSTPFARLYDRTLRIANGLRARGVEPTTRVGILCRNHLGFVEATLATCLLGADSLLLNPGFGARQLEQVLEREGVDVIVYDEDFEPIVSEAAAKQEKILAWRETGGERVALDDLVERERPFGLGRPLPPGRITILTSGTTGPPKGAQRSTPSSIAAVREMVGLLEALDLRVGDTMVLAAPAFHAWGDWNLWAAILLQCTVVLQRRFDPEATLRAMAEHAAGTLVAIPIMLQRILELPDSVTRKYATPALRRVLVSGSALPGALALRWMDRFGDNLYNLYGSTEVAHASIASPEDLRAAPGTAGRPPWGTRVRILDSRGAELPAGQTGRIFVENTSQFSGYTDGQTRETQDGLMCTGDLGHFDTAGRLFVEGREDDMIVSGGENVFPGEVEDLLARHPEVADVAVVGVEDPDFGQRLAAFVVLTPSATSGPDELRAYVRDQLARHKVPREISIVSSLPRNASGKLLRRVLQS